MSKPGKAIAVDIDDVISASAEGFLTWSNEQLGTNLTIDDYQEHWGQMWQVDHEEVIRRAHAYYASGHQEKFAPIDDAYDVLRALKERFRLIIITSRRDSGSGLTDAWIKKHYEGIFEDIVFSGFYNAITEDSFHRTKGDIAKQTGVDFLIDDQLKHAVAAAEVGIPSVLFGNYPWNQADALPEGVVRAHGWKDVLNFFNDK